MFHLFHSVRLLQWPLKCFQYDDISVIDTIYFIFPRGCIIFSMDVHADAPILRNNIQTKITQ